MGRRGRCAVATVELTMLPLLVVLLIVALFLLTRFSPTGELTCMCRAPDVPDADQGDELVLAPVVRVMRGTVVFNGVIVGDAIRESLREHAQMFSQSPTVLIYADRNETFHTVWPAMEAALSSGARTVSLVVRLPAP